MTDEPREPEVVYAPGDPSIVPWAYTVLHDAGLDPVRIVVWMSTAFEFQDAASAKQHMNASLAFLRGEDTPPKATVTQLKPKAT